jgi:DNA-binding phage protein
MKSFKLTLPPKDRAAGRFLAQVHAAFANAAAFQKRHVGLTSAEVARRAECDKAVSRLLSGAGNPTIRTLGEIAWAMNMRPEIVLTPIDDGLGQNELTDFSGRARPGTSGRTVNVRFAAPTEPARPS